MKMIEVGMVRTAVDNCLFQHSAIYEYSRAELQHAKFDVQLLLISVSSSHTLRILKPTLHHLVLYLSGGAIESTLSCCGCLSIVLLPLLTRLRTHIYEGCVATLRSFVAPAVL